MDQNQLIDSVLQKVAEDKIVEEKENVIINKCIRPSSRKNRLINDSKQSDNDLTSSFSLNYKAKGKSLNKYTKQSSVWNRFNLFPAKHILCSNERSIFKRKLKKLKILPAIT